VNAGKKILAIKLYREATGVGLKEAKDYVDSLDPAYRKRR
jgi:ribosomal protein L7/L12